MGNFTFTFVFCSETHLRWVRCWVRFEKQISNVGSNNTGIKIEHNLFKFLRLKNLNKLEEKMLRLLSEFGRLKGFLYHLRPFSGILSARQRVARR